VDAIFVFVVKLRHRNFLPSTLFYRRIFQVIVPGNLDIILVHGPCRVIASRPVIRYSVPRVGTLLRSRLFSNTRSGPREFSDPNVPEIRVYVYHCCLTLTCWPTQCTTGLPTVLMPC